jgi:hypothetical protein
VAIILRATIQRTWYGGYLSLFDIVLSARHADGFSSIALNEQFILQQLQRHPPKIIIAIFRRRLIFWVNNFRSLLMSRYSYIKKSSITKCINKLILFLY